MIDSSIQKNFNEFEAFIGEVDALNLPSYKDGFFMRVDRIAESLKDHPKKSELADQFYQICGKLSPSIMHQRCREKPLGYAGDFLIIDWIYTQNTADEGYGKLFDLMFQSYEATQAVRNRKRYFINKCNALMHSKPGKLNILDFGCGPCRDVIETFVESNNGKNLSFHCVDMEPQALDYAKNLVRIYDIQQDIHFEQANIFRLKTERKYDVIWSAGLFDYLDDRLVIILLKKIWRYLKDGGQIIFGNFSPNNPTRNGMELVVKWFLIHRTADDLIRLVNEAKLPFSEIEVEYEPLGVNLFCVITK